jgi:hypothetical protein
MVFFVHLGSGNFELVADIFYVIAIKIYLKIETQARGNFESFTFFSDLMVVTVIGI